MPHFRTVSRPNGFETSNRATWKNIHPTQLPLHCPLPGTSLWNSHPRVFLPIEDAPDQKVRCPYCGTLYTLVDTNS